MSRVKSYNPYMAMMLSKTLIRLEVMVALILAGVVSLVVKAFLT